MAKTLEKVSDHVIDVQEDEPDEDEEDDDPAPAPDATGTESKKDQ